MRRIHATLLAVALATTTYTAEVRLPSAPQPLPSPDAPVTLTEELVYVVDSDVECVVLCSPRGKLRIAPMKGPVTFRGRFVDGIGKVENREFKGPFLYTVEAAEAGPCELIVVPKGGAEKDVIRRTIISVVGPRPPPDPQPKPDPQPQPVTDVKWCIVVEETSQRTADTAKVLGDLAYWKGLEARGVKYRFYDKDSPEAKQNKYVEFQAEAGGLPFVLLLDSTGKKLDVFKLPVTTAELDAKIGGGK